VAADMSKKSSTRKRFQEMLESGKLDDKEVEVDLDKPRPKVGFVNPAGSLEDVTEHLQGLFEGGGSDNKKQRRKMPIKDALKAITEEEASKLVNEEEVRAKALHHVEQNGIVFIDEIDKVAVRSSGKNIDVSRSGVQRDLLPLVEGTTVSTKCGMVKTDHILFIASGAFHLSKPSDLLPELQGRFPIRVELNALTVDDFKKILTSTDACLIEQYKALLATEGVKVKFASDAIDNMAQYAYHVNEKTENIGARRLHTIVEKLLEDILFDPSVSSKYDIDGAFVENKLGLISNSEDLSRYIL
jgi:ATP-dependent HslUV protease ATP-binding subunit HslU